MSILDLLSTCLYFRIICHDSLPDAELAAGHPLPLLLLALTSYQQPDSDTEECWLSTTQESDYEV